MTKVDELERPFLDHVRAAMTRRGMRQQDLANYLIGYGVAIHDTGISKALAQTGPRRALRLAEVLAIASVLDIDLAGFIPDRVQCPTCSGLPPEGFTCNQCGNGKGT